MADGASMQIGGQIYAPLAASILLSCQEDEFPAKDLYEAGQVARQAAKLYLVANGMAVPGIEIVKGPEGEEGSEIEEEASDSEPDEGDAKSDIIALP